MSNETLELKLNKITELTLIGNWLNGQDRQDIHDIPDSVFNNQKLYEACKQGISQMQCLRDGIITIDNVADITSGMDLGKLAYEAALQEAYKIALNRVKKSIMETEDVNRIKQLTEFIQRLTALLNGQKLIKSTDNFVEIFLNEMKDRKENTAVTYGLTDLDGQTGGIHKGQLIVVGARPSVGKSAFTLQIADNVRRQGKKVLYFPLEMTSYETFERLLVRGQIATQEELRSGNLTAEKEQACINFLKELEQDHNFIIYEGVNNLDAIINKIKSDKPYLVILDQLRQIMPVEKTKDTREQYKVVTAKLKNVALTEQTAIILVSQLNRDAEEKGASLTSLHESDSTGQDADTVLLLTKSKDVYEKDLGKIDLTIAKQRQGNSGTVMQLVFSGKDYSFKNNYYEGYTPLKAI